jgi:hypothetical protein
VVALVGQDGREGDAGVIVDGDVQVLPTGTAGLFAAISGDAVAGLADTRQALDVEVDQITGGAGSSERKRLSPARRRMRLIVDRLQFEGNLQAVAALAAPLKNLFQ